jgi:hypothetical protein
MHGKTHTNCEIAVSVGEGREEKGRSLVVILFYFLLGDEANTAKMNCGHVGICNIVLRIH